MEETNLETNSFNHETTEFPKPEGKSDPPRLSAKCSRVRGYGNKSARRNSGKRYPLRSSFRGTRVLRSASKKANVTSPLKNAKVDHVQVKRKRIKKTRRPLNDEFSRIRRSVRYLLHRVSYEQSLIDAYAGEGWKGQSSEKIKPEMELQRAKSEILRCKLKIRSIFQQIDASIAEGKLDDSLFDTKGEIYSEDVC